MSALNDVTCLKWHLHICVPLEKETPSPTWDDAWVVLFNKPVSLWENCIHIISIRKFWVSSMKPHLESGGRHRPSLDWFPIASGSSKPHTHTSHSEQNETVWSKQRLIRTYLTLGLQLNCMLNSNASSTHTRCSQRYRTSPNWPILPRFEFHMGIRTWPQWTFGITIVRRLHHRMGIVTNISLFSMHRIVCDKTALMVRIWSTNSVIDSMVGLGSRTGAKVVSFGFKC